MRPKTLQKLRTVLVRAAIVGAGATIFAAVFTVATWPDVSVLAHENPQTTAFIEHARARGDKISWSWVRYEEISDHLKRAVIVSEDISFFSHAGFDTSEMKVAAREALAGKRLRGASTITQQLAKNLWLAPSRSPIRKLKEAILTRQLERHLGKRRILELYLNVAEFGPGIFGAEAASITYFGLPASQINARQAAELAAALPRPSTWHPGGRSRAYTRAVERTLVRMDHAGWIDGLL